MTSGMLVPVIAGLAVGAALIAVFSSQFGGQIGFQQDANPLGSKPPEIQLLVAEGGNPIGRHTGLQGSYCWQSGCADTALLISGKIIGIERGATIEFDTVSQDERVSQPTDYAINLVRTDRLDVFNTVGDVQIATYRSSDDLIFLDDSEKGKFVIEVPPGDYVLLVFATWFSEDQISGRDVSYGHVSYFYRIAVVEH